MRQSHRRGHRRGAGAVRHGEVRVEQKVANLASKVPSKESDADSSSASMPSSAATASLPFQLRRRRRRRRRRQAKGSAIARSLPPGLTRFVVRKLPSPRGATCDRLPRLTRYPSSARCLLLGQETWSTRFRSRMSLRTHGWSSRHASSASSHRKPSSYLVTTEPRAASRDSKTVTFAPACLSLKAATSPLRLAPTTATDGGRACCCCCCCGWSLLASYSFLSACMCELAAPADVVESSPLASFVGAARLSLIPNGRRTPSRNWLTASRRCARFAANDRSRAEIACCVHLSTAGASAAALALTLASPSSSSRIACVLRSRRARPRACGVVRLCKVVRESLLCDGGGLGYCGEALGSRFFATLPRRRTSLSPRPQRGVRSAENSGAIRRPRVSVPGFLPVVKAFSHKRGPIAGLAHVAPPLFRII